jgi:hypothetical protein
MIFPPRRCDPPLSAYRVFKLLHNQNSETHAHAFVYGCEIIAEKIDFLSRTKSVENENPELVDRDDEILF